MAKSQTIWLIIIALVVVAIFVIWNWPKSYLTEETAVNLQPGDEVVIQDQFYTFQSSENTDDESTIKVIFSDSSKVLSSIIIPPTTLLTINKTMPWWGTAPPPPPPQAVPVPIPVPIPASPSGTPTTPIPPSALTPTPPTPAPTPQPLPPGVSAICGNGVVETGEQCEPPNTSTCNANCQIIVATPYPPTCSDFIWNGDESDMDCGGSCPKCLNTGIYTSCWNSSDCQSNNCDISGAQRPLPVGYTIQTLQQLAGQSWIIPYQGICR